MGYGLKYARFTIRFRKEIQNADDSMVKIMNEEIKKEMNRRFTGNKKR